MKHIHKRISKIPALCGIAAVAASITACGGVPRPEAKLSETKAAIRGAEEVDAREVPTASLHLKMANDGVATAEKLIAAEEHERATRVLERAKLDAELAILMTKTERTKQAAKQALDRVESLQQP